MCSTGVDVASVVTITIADEVRSTGTLRVVNTIVEGAYYVAEDPLDCLVVLHHRLLNELTDIANENAKCGCVWMR